MNPARAMGTFLRVWRSEWAGLTRAQLALAVSSRCKGRKPVTARIIQEWEDGQPPKSSAELNGLLEVMHRHGVGDAEVWQFRGAVFAACAGRQYPDVLNGEPLPYRDDLEEIAQAAYNRQIDAPHPPDVVTVVASLKELEGVVIHGLGPGATRAQERQQEAALAYLRAAVADCLGRHWAYMVPHAAEAFSRNADFLEAYFGPAGLGGHLSVLAQRTMATFHRAHAGRSRSSARHLLELSEQAEARGELHAGADAFLLALHCLAELQEGAFGTLMPQVRRHIDTATSSGVPGTWDVAQLNLVWAALAEGLRDEAERHLADFEDRSDRLLDHRVIQWREARGWLALEAGHYEEALAYLGEGWAPLIERCNRRRSTSYAQHLHGRRRNGRQ